MPQSVLLTGEKGTGLLTLATEIAGKHIAALLQPHNTKKEVDAENGTISIETIRQLYDQTKTKSTSRSVVIIDDADRMSRGAQAAFLKLLEEPTSSTHFILTSHNPQGLVNTIHSRVQHLHIRLLTSQQTHDFIKNLNIPDNKKRQQIEFIAAGLQQSYID